MTAFHGKCCGDPECGYGTRSEPPEPDAEPLLDRASLLLALLCGLGLVGIAVRVVGG